ncbi:MAG: SulP family inorganic anion transporter [Actinobacteria bacterium]|nr:SulP family inorganic anion transporter [Actinomycetota bacterium]
MSSVLSRFTPVSLRGYKRAWLSADVIAGLTLAAVAIPETMGYTSIAQTPIVTGLYTVIFPTLLFALFGASKLLVVGADSATAAILAAGLLSANISGVTAGSPLWLAYTSFIALICGGLLLLARVLRLGFLGDFLSASVLVGFLTGVGVQVFSGQIPDMLGIAKGTGTWLEQQWYLVTHLDEISWTTFAFAAATLVIILGFKKFLPKVPGAIVAVILLIIVSAVTQASTHGVAVVGAVTGGFPPIGLPQGINLANFGSVVAIAFSCFILIIAQSAATSRSFAMKHGDNADVNRDLIGLSGANFAAGLSGTFVVNGSPTKTQILDEQKGRTQLANITMSAVVLLVVLFFTGLLTDMPKAVLAGIVFLIGVDLVDIKGLKLIWRRRRGEAIIAIITAVVVCAVGVEQGIILAIVLSLLDLIYRQYKPNDFVVGINKSGDPTYQAATPGTQSAPGLLIFRYDSDLFYANANRFIDDVEALINDAPDPVRWLILDMGAIADIDYSAGNALGGLLDFLKARDIHFAMARADEGLIQTLKDYELDKRVSSDQMYGNLIDAVNAFDAQPATPSAS